jgi:hypothetical protein
VWARLTCRNGNPWWPFYWKRARLAAPRIGGELCRHANNLKRQEWCHAFARDPITFGHRLIAEQHNRAGPLITIITERRLLIVCALAVAVAFGVWRTRNGREWNALTVGAMLP